MADQVVPTNLPIGPGFEVVTLDGVPYLLTFAWNIRALCWYLDVATSEGDPIACGVKLVVGWTLLRACADPRKPPGRLGVISTTSDDSPPGLTDLGPGGRCALLYRPVGS